MKDDAKRARIPIRRLVFITAVPFLLLGFPISCLWLFLIGGEPKSYLASLGVFCNLALGWAIALWCAYRKNPEGGETMFNEPTKQEEEDLKQATLGK